MLILKLRRGQSARIGPQVVVTVVRNEDGALVVGIEAPTEWKISRQTQLPEGTVQHANAQTGP